MIGCCAGRGALKALSLWVAAAFLSGGAALPASASESLRPWPGGATPPLVLKTPEGETVDLSQLRGRVVLVNFWATWCAPCVEEMPALARVRSRLRPQGFEVVAVNQGEMPERVSRFRDKARLEFPVVLDRDKAAGKAWRVRALPTTFVVDAAGTIRLFAEGELDTGEALEAALLALLSRERAAPAVR